MNLCFAGVSFFLFESYHLSHPVPIHRLALPSPVTIGPYGTLPFTVASRLPSLITSWTILIGLQLSRLTDVGCFLESAGAAPLFLAS